MNMQFTKVLPITDPRAKDIWEALEIKPERRDFLMQASQVEIDKTSPEIYVPKIVANISHLIETPQEMLALGFSLGTYLSALRSPEMPMGVEILGPLGPEELEALVNRLKNKTRNPLRGGGMMGEA
jgi:hypothetical protein